MLPKNSFAITSKSTTESERIGQILKKHYGNYEDVHSFYYTAEPGSHDGKVYYVVDGGNRVWFERVYTFKATTIYTLAEFEEILLGTLLLETPINNSYSIF